MCKVSRSSFQQRKKSRLQEEKRLAEKKKANDELKELLRKISRNSATCRESAVSKYFFGETLESMLAANLSDGS